MTMTATDREPARLVTESRLHVAREDIRFRDVAAGQVVIEVTVHNLGSQRSRPTFARIEAAPLGAFVPWRPLMRLAVPAIEPGDSTVLRAHVKRATPEPLGAPDRVPPRRLLTAVGADDQQPRQTVGLQGWLRSLSRTRRPSDAEAELPFDLFDLMARKQTHFAGNLNVFVGQRPVERHLAQALRIYPGRTNIAMFMVGSSKPDAYAFRVAGYGNGWDVALFDASGASSLFLGIKDGSIVKPGTWLDAPSMRMMILGLCPPEWCGRENVEVHVCQRSSGKEAIVEFSFDPAAAGPGCYVVT
jgi:hypothetical protein